MKTIDTRRLSPQAQEQVRLKVVAVVWEGMPKRKASRLFGVSRTSIDSWLAKVEDGGLRALKSKPRGRPRHSRLPGWQAANVVRLIESGCPDQLRLPFALWTREAVRQLLRNRFGLEVSVWTVGRYLGHWGLTPQKPLRRAYEQNPEAVKRWLRETYPAIRRRAKREKAEIHWGDEMGLRSDDQRGRSYGRRGQTPVIFGTGRRFGCNMISTVTNRGRLAFMVFDERFTAPVCLRFLKRLIRHSRRTIFLIWDRHPVHRSGVVQQWLHRNRRRIRMFFLPGYSPELNPDEYLNNDAKSNGVGRERPADQLEMMEGLRSYLRQTQRRPQVVRNYFNHEEVAYAAA
jgi:transposase